jgi:S1-C subfamily serine protease
LVVGGLFKCNKCTRWHSTVAGGYVIDPAGIAVTCHHVITGTNAVTFVAMTRSGRVYPVREVLAGSAVNDLAIIQLEGQGFTPLPLATDAPPGAPIYAISHPDHNFYSLTAGLVSRYARLRKPAGTMTVMEITADFAKGSSGCPVFNECGAVVGTISSTHSVYYDTHDGKKDNLQMVFKRCVPTTALLELIRP